MDEEPLMETSETDAQAKLAAEWEQGLGEELGEEAGVDPDALAEQWGSESDGAPDQAAMAGQWAAESAHLNELEGTPVDTSAGVPGTPGPDLEAIMNIPVSLAMEVGRTQISIRNLLQLNQGSVVELDRMAGEPLDVLVNGTLIAHGEVVVVNDKFGIRLTDVINAHERVKKLR